MKITFHRSSGGSGNLLETVEVQLGSISSFEHKNEVINKSLPEYFGNGVKLTANYDPEGKLISVYIHSDVYDKGQFIIRLNVCLSVPCSYFGFAAPTGVWVDCYLEP